ncbi:MAG: mechanosensitive ion channel family protein [Candidatus Zixiibacteriota bacterium]|nr:MAG: mechanosensitive ion channel family protein [candidate division Zixibacteria bacterium]
MENLLDKIYEWGAQYGMQIIGAIAILVIGRIVVGIITGIVRRLMKKAKIDGTLTSFVAGLTRIGLMVFVLLAALNSLGVQTTSFIAIIGAAGLAVGLALQGSLANFASGVMLIIFRPFKNGDFVEAGGSMGVVESIGIFSTTMKTVDNKEIIIPNSNITGSNIVNYSAKVTRRVDLVFGIGYDDDLRKAKSILERLLSEDERILKDPVPVVAVSELADSSVNFIVRPWVKTEDYWVVYWDLMEKVKLTFDAEGISIPYPQQDVHMFQAAS